jgi:flagellar biosynthesis anti-sigma factor FlgM
MRIDSSQGPQPPPESGPISAQNPAATRSSAWNIASVGEDQAQLSGAHVQAEALATQASQLPEAGQEQVRQGRVAALRQAVLSGQYQASPESVAGAMFDHMLAFSPA